MNSTTNELDFISLTKFSRELNKFSGAIFDQNSRQLIRTINPVSLESSYIKMNLMKSQNAELEKIKSIYNTIRNDATKTDVLTKQRNSIKRLNDINYSKHGTEGKFYSYKDTVKSITPQVSIYNITLDRGSMLGNNENGTKKLNDMIEDMLVARDKYLTKSLCQVNKDNSCKFPTKNKKIAINNLTLPNIAQKVPLINSKRHQTKSIKVINKFSLDKELNPIVVDDIHLINTYSFPNAFKTCKRKSHHSNDNKNELKNHTKRSFIATLFKEAMGIAKLELANDVLYRKISNKKTGSNEAKVSKPIVIINKTKIIKSSIVDDVISEISEQTKTKNILDKNNELIDNIIGHENQDIIRKKVDEVLIV